jgi:hypothetical protein
MLIGAVFTPPCSMVGPDTWTSALITTPSPILLATMLLTPIQGVWHMTAKSRPRRQSVPKKGRTATARGAAPPSARPKKDAVGTHRPGAAEREFVRATIVRGQAVEAGQPLPSGATHEIVTGDEGAQPVLKRKRFSTC